MVRPNRRSTRPEDQPVYTSPTGMDFEKRRIVAPLGLGSSVLSDTLRYQLYYLSGVDGGRISEPTPALDDLQPDLDGGEL